MNTCKYSLHTLKRPCLARYIVWCIHKTPSAIECHVMLLLPHAAPHSIRILLSALLRASQPSHFPIALHSTSDSIKLSIAPKRKHCHHIPGRENWGRLVRTNETLITPALHYVAACTQCRIIRANMSLVGFRRFFFFT